MNNIKLKKLLIDIPTKLCRNMSNEFVNTILKDLKINFTQHHFMILKLVGEKERLFVTEIVDILSITKSQMTALVDKLISLGYITRTNDIDDRRKIYLSLSNEGKKITNKINIIIDKQIDKTLIKLSNKEMKDLENGLLVFHKFYSLCNNRDKC